MDEIGGDTNEKNPSVKGPCLEILLNLVNWYFPNEEGQFQNHAWVKESKGKTDQNMTAHQITEGSLVWLRFHIATGFFRNTVVEL